MDKMVDYLRTTNDEVTKTEVVKRIGELAERFAPDTQWFLDTMNQVGILRLHITVMLFAICWPCMSVQWSQCHGVSPRPLHTLPDFITLQVWPHVQLFYSLPNLG